MSNGTGKQILMLSIAIAAILGLRTMLRPYDETKAPAVIIGTSQPSPSLPLPLPPTAPVRYFAKDVKCDSRVWEQDWNDDIAGALDEFGDRLMSGAYATADVKKLCPSYFGLPDAQRKAFWALVIASVSCPESGYNPKEVYKEPPPLNVESIGLMQLSYEDVQGHKRCELDKSKLNAYDPKINLRCAVVILDDEMKRLNALFSPYSYWSTLQTDQPTKLAKTMAQFNKYKSQLGFCQ